MHDLINRVESISSFTCIGSVHAILWVPVCHNGSKNRMWWPVLGAVSMHASIRYYTCSGCFWENAKKNSLAQDVVATISMQACKYLFLF